MSCLGVRMAKTLAHYDDTKRTPTYFIEPDGYLIARIFVTNSNVLGYGYISKDNYEKYLNGNLTGVVEILNPYIKGKSVALNVCNIVSIQIGEYHDYRNIFM